MQLVPKLITLSTWLRHGTCRLFPKLLPGLGQPFLFKVAKLSLLPSARRGQTGRAGICGGRGTPRFFSWDATASGYLAGLQERPAHKYIGLTAPPRS